MSGRRFGPGFEPRTVDEYLARFATNQKIEGHGVGNVYITLPCPFCAAPNFMRYEILAVQAKMTEGATCKECGRGAKAVFTKSDYGTAFEMVQTAGPDQPEWLEPKMRRVA